MRTSFHSVHEPMCAICKKHCRSFESLREHLTGNQASNNSPFIEATSLSLTLRARSLYSSFIYITGPLPKLECNNIFNVRGCRFCLAILESPHARRIHQEGCQLSNVITLLLITVYISTNFYSSGSNFYHQFLVSGTYHSLSKFRNCG